MAHAARRTSHALPRSRFLEGSMKDRASTAPPAAFLGLQDDDTPLVAAPPAAPTPRRPMMRLWDGVCRVLGKEEKQRGEDGRERLGGEVEKQRSHLEKQKSHLEKQKSHVEKQRGEGGFGKLIGTGERCGGGGYEEKEKERVSRQEVLHTYHTLVAQGFFAGHATPSARLPRGTKRKGDEEGGVAGSKRVRREGGTNLDDASSPVKSQDDTPVTTHDDMTPFRSSHDMTPFKSHRDSSPFKTSDTHGSSPFKSHTTSPFKSHLTPFKSHGADASPKRLLNPPRVLRRRLVPSRPSRT